MNSQIIYFYNPYSSLNSFTLRVKKCIIFLLDAVEVPHSPYYPP
jgi:hypothetical protein